MKWIAAGLLAALASVSSAGEGTVVLEAARLIDGKRRPPGRAIGALTRMP